MITTISSIDTIIGKFKFALNIATLTLQRSTPYYFNRYILHKPILPRFLLLGITYKCNARCLMCSIWQKQDLSEEMSLPEIKSIFDNKKFWKNLHTVAFTGGEPFLRKNLPEIVEILSKNCRSLQLIEFNTNGLLVNSVYQNMMLMLKKLSPGIALNITLSIDGLGATHDKIRGIPHAFSRVSETLEKLQSLKTKYPNFSIGINCVLQPLNVNEMHTIEKFYHERNIRIGFTFPITDDDFFCEANDYLSFSEDELSKIKDFYLSSQWSYDYFHFIKYIEGERRTQVCIAGYADLFIDPNGTVFPCNYLGKSLGNIKASPIEQIWYSEKASEIRKNIPHYSLCKNCVQNCDIPFIAEVDAISYYKDYFRYKGYFA